MERRKSRSAQTSDGVPILFSTKAAAPAGLIPPPTPDQVEVKMKYVLPAPPFDIEDQPVSSLINVQVVRYLPCPEEQFGDHGTVLVGEVVDASDVPCGDDEDVNRGLGADVFEGHDRFILIHEIGRSLPFHDLTESAVFHILDSMGPGHVGFMNDSGCVSTEPAARYISFPLTVRKREIKVFLTDCRECESGSDRFRVSTEQGPSPVALISTKMRKCIDPRFQKHFEVCTISEDEKAEHEGGTVSDLKCKMN